MLSIDCKKPPKELPLCNTIRGNEFKKAGTWIVYAFSPRTSTFFVPASTTGESPPSFSSIMHPGCLLLLELPAFASPLLLVLQLGTDRLRHSFFLVWISCSSTLPFPEDGRGIPPPSGDPTAVTMELPRPPPPVGGVEITHPSAVGARGRAPH